MNFFSIPILLSAPSSSVTSSNLTLWELLLAGGWVMVPLFLASFAAMFLIILYFLTLRKDHVCTDDYKNQVEKLIQERKFSDILELSRKNSQVLARVLEQSAAFLQKNPSANFAAVREIAQAEGNRQAAALNQQVVYLMDIGVVAPMLGLFGTVVGILRSFGSIASEATPMRTMLLAGGVSQALIATAAGLIVGISSMVFYSYFRGRVHHLISELEASATNLITSLGVHLGK